MLAELRAQPLPDVCPVVRVEVDSEHADIRGNLSRIGASGLPLQGFANAIREERFRFTAGSFPRRHFFPAMAFMLRDKYRFHVWNNSALFRRA